MKVSKKKTTEPYFFGAAILPGRVEGGGGGSDGVSLTSQPALLCSRQWWVGREYVEQSLAELW